MNPDYDPRVSKGPRQAGIDIVDDGGNIVDHVDYGTNGITGAGGTQDVYQYTSPEGEKTYYAREADLPSGISLDAETGKIKIQVPEKWKDDEKVKSWADSTTLKLISGNYRNNKDVKYPHPYDETKQITTQEYVDYLNNGLKAHIAALEAETPTKMNLIQYFGGNDKKNAAIDNLSAEDVITMSLSYDKDDSWVPLPKYMLVAYPQLKKLSTYKNGFVQKKDFLDNFYNIESGAITERYAYGIATAPQKVLENIEDLDADEIAKTVGFSRFISQVDPKRSPISQFLQAGDALARGFYGALTDWTKDTAELIGNLATFSWATGEKADVSEFMGGLLFGEKGFLTPSSTEALAPAMQQMAATNKDALTKAQAGLVQGAIAGKALDMVISTAAINKVASIASNAITNAITSAGGRALGNAMTTTRAAEYTTEGLATVSNATDMASTAGTIAANQTILTKTATSGSAAYTAFFEQTLGSALHTYSKNIGGMTTYFRAMPTAQFATIVNSAAKIANAATYANTAVGVLGSMVFAAIVNNKELTNKVLSGEATSDEAKDLLRQTLFDTAKVQAASWMLGLNPKIAGLENKFSDKLESINQAMSQFFTGLGAKAASPWIKFMQWLVSNKAAAATAGGAKLSNAAVARAEAVKEAVLLNEAKQYATNLSRAAGTNAPRLLEEALASAGINIGTSMADTLKKLEEVGYNFDPADLAMSEFEGWQGSMAELRNVLTTWGDINTNVSKVVLEFTNPDIQPTISQQMSEISKADADLINAEKEAGLLDDKTYKTDLKLGKQDEGYIYSAHSEELSRYIVRKYEMGVIANEARANGITDLDNYQPYVEARARYTAAAELVPENIRNIADTKYLPALKKAEHEIINVMMDDGVYPRSFVNAMRAGGKFGTDGNDWIRLVARKDMPKGVYNPYSKTVKRDNTIALGNFSVLNDEDITWPGNGLQELITEYGVARSEKAFLDASKRATGLVTDVKVPGSKTAAAGRIEEFKTDFEKAVKQGFKSFTEDVEGTAAVGNKRANQQREFYNEVAKLGGVQTADIDELRSVMHDKGVTTADSIVDQASLDNYLDISSKEARDLLLKYVGDKLDNLTLQGPKMSDVERDEFNNLEKALNANAVLREADALEKTMRVRYIRGAENKSTSGHGYHDPYLKTEKRIANGEIAEEDRLKDFAEQLQDDTTIGYKASQYLAYRALAKRDFSNPSIFENIPHSQLRKKINRYIELNEKAKAENQGLTADNWGEFWKNATPNVRKILRSELERTANATGYGIKGTSTEVKQPRTVKYSDYAASYAEDPSIEQALKDAIKNEQFNKLNNIKEKNSDKYEKLLERLDRINAANNSDVKNSNVVQDAAEEYRKNMKSLRDSTILTEEFSYLAQLPTAKGSLKDFVESNNIKIPEGDGDLRNKVKEALWNMLQEGKDLPSIKGLKKTDYKLDPSKKDSYKNIDVESLLKNPGNGLIVDKKEFFKLLGKTELFRNPAGPNSLKYELNKEDLYNDIDDAIDGMMDLIKKNGRANSAIESMTEYINGTPSDMRFEFSVLCEVLSKNGISTYKQSITDLARRVVDGAISDRKAIVKGNLRSLYEQVETAIYDKLESRLASAKNALESAGETVESETITDILTRHAKEIGDAEADPFIVKTTNKDGEIQYERVSPAIAGIYNERGVYEPLGTGTKILSNLALLKKINTTDLSPRSFMKQTFSDPAMAFATVGALPGSLQALRDEIEAQFGPDVFQALQKVDTARYHNLELIAEREGITLEEALARNLKAIANTEVPFTLLNEEILRQAKVSKYGLKAAKKMNAKSRQDQINSALRKVSDKLGTPQNIRETYVRKLAGETAFLKALRKGYSLHQSEIFRVHAINTATTNFRLKHSMFNKFRSTVPYLTSGISGAKSFWQMFEMDPLGVTSRMFTGFIAPIIYFMGEIVSDEETKKKYEALAESEKDNHIFIKVGSQIIPIPVGEEIGQFTNIAVHLVETLYNENKYGFWSLMLNDLVGLIPGVDLTGFTDPDMWNAITGSPSFPDIIENGIAKALSGAMPPLAQSLYMANTGRDMYTGNKVNTAYIDIDDDGNPVIMTSSTSQFAKAVANVIGGDAKVIQKVISGIGGTVLMDVLDTVTSAVQFVGSGGEEGSLTTGVERFFENASKPFAANGYDELDKRFSGGITELFYKKDAIVHGDPNMNQYIKYNQEIAKEKDPEHRQLLKNKRNDLLNGFYKEVETLVKNYRDAGGTLDRDKFSKVVSLLTFEDAVRADRQFMDLNTDYSDAYNQAMQTLYDMGIENPDGISSLGYIYTDKETGKPEIKMWNPVQMQIINDTIWDGGDIHRAQIEAIINDGTKNSIKNLSKTESAGEQPFWDKYNATGKLSDKEWDAIDDLREAFNAQVVVALADYMDAYGAANILSNDAVIDYLEDIIKVPSEYETVKGRNVSSGNGKLNKQQGFAESYIKRIFGVK